MNRIICLLAVSLLCNGLLHGQNAISKEECYDFVNHFHFEQTYYLLESGITFQGFCWSEEGLPGQKEFEDSFFTDSDKTFIRQQIKRPVVKSWVGKKLKRAAVVESFEISQLFNNGIEEGWADFHKQFNYDGYFQFSPPLFSIKKDRCMFYVSHSCGGLCGSGNIYFCQKKGDKWVVVNTVGCWVS